MNPQGKLYGPKEAENFARFCQTILPSLSCRKFELSYISSRAYLSPLLQRVNDQVRSEPRLAFNRIVVLRYRSHMESRRLAPGTINLRLGAVRRLAYEAADCGLLSSDLAAGIRLVKDLKKNGVRMGDWLTADQARSLWQSPDDTRIKGKRDRALLALLLACGLRRHEAVNLRVEHLHQR